MAAESDIPVYANRVDPAVEAFCGSGWMCEVAGAITDLWLVVAVGLAVGAGIASVAYLRSARSALEEEQSRTAAEQAAFEAFARQVAELPTAPVTPPNQPTGGAVSVMDTSRPSASPLDDVREAYRESVMAVAHYDEEYGEPLAKNMAVEFGEDIATTVSDGDQLIPQLQHALLSAAKQAARERSSLLSALDREEESLREAAATFEAVQSELDTYHPQALREDSYEVLVDRWEELDTLERRCSTVLDARQHRLTNEPMDKGLPADTPSLFVYLYRSLEVDYPVLACGTALLDQIRTSRRTLTRIASNHP